MKDPALALELARKANEMTDHTQPAYLATRARAYHATGDRRQAVVTQRRALEELPDEAPDRDDYEEALATGIARVQDMKRQAAEKDAGRRGAA